MGLGAVSASGESASGDSGVGAGGEGVPADGGGEGRVVGAVGMSGSSGVRRPAGAGSSAHVTCGCLVLATASARARPIAAFGSRRV